MIQHGYVPNDRKNLKRLKELTEILERAPIVSETNNLISHIELIMNDVKPILNREKNPEFKLKYYDTLFKSITELIQKEKDITK